MQIYNQEIRKRIKKNKILKWQIAYKLGIAESTLNRWLRVKLHEYKEKAINEAIDELIKEGDGEVDL